MDRAQKRYNKKRKSERRKANVERDGKAKR